jgi:site-specific DNA-methyltransferase (adenine-specific)
MINMMQGDCMELLARTPDKYYELAIVDPPYGIGDFHNSEWKGKPYNKTWEIKWNETPPHIDYFKELYRVSKNQIIWGSNYYIGCIRDVGAIIWDKGNSSGVGSDCEIASQSFDVRVVKHYLQNIGFIGPEKGHKIHPCQKPVALYKWLLSRYAKPGDKILDTHGGSGSICIACHDLGFDLDWIELDADYYAAACKRYADHASQGTLFEPKPVEYKQADLIK